MKCYLSGMPELRLGLNDKVMFESTGRSECTLIMTRSVPDRLLNLFAAARGKAIEMEDVKFHQCVRLSRFENDRTISFIPPDGEFELMSYRLSTPVKPLIWAEAAIESHKGSRIEYMVKVKAQFKRRSTANNVEIYVPVPDDASSPRFRAATGSVQYAPDKSAFVWKIKQLAGGREFLMRAHFSLPSVRPGMFNVLMIFRKFQLYLTICTDFATKQKMRWSVERPLPSSLKFRISLFPVFRCGTSRLSKRVDIRLYLGSVILPNMETTIGVFILSYKPGTC